MLPFRFIAIVKKEVLDARRDGKSLTTALAMPIMFAVMMLGSLLFIVSLQDQSKTFILSIKGAEHAPPLIDWLEESGITIQDFSADPITAIKNKEHTLIVEITHDFAKDFREQRPAQINIYSDHSDTHSQVKANRIKGLIEHWSASIGSLRLIARNVSPGIMRATVTNDINVANPQRVAAKILSGLPLIILMIAFVSGIGMSADMSAGEKERKTLEPLLINPVSYSTLFMGKWIAAVLVTLAIAFFGVGLQFMVIAFAPLAELGLRINLGVGDFLLMLFILLPIMFVATALQLLVSFVAKSFKDAQSYNSLVMLLPMIPGVYLIFNTGSTVLWKMFIPILGPQILLMDIISGEPISALAILCASLTSSFVAAILAWLAILKIKRESILFS